jgi:LysM repeat protein
MKSIGQLFLGLLAALGSSVLVLAATSLALLESGVELAQAPTATIVTQSPALRPLLPEEATPTPVPATATSACPYPAGWVIYTIVPGDTLEMLAQEWGTTAVILYEGNCLPSQSLVAGTNLYHPVPPTVTSTGTATETAAATSSSESTYTVTPTRVLCGPPAGWITYLVKPGDNLFRLGLAYGVTVERLMSANCLSSEDIRAGQRLYVPNVPTRVPSPTPKTPAPTEPPVVETTAAPVETTEAPVDQTTEPASTPQDNAP